MKVAWLRALAWLHALAWLNWQVPDLRILYRGRKTLTVHIPCRSSMDFLQLLFDSTGGKAKGDAEWLARKHGPSKPRDLSKVQLGIAGETS